MLRKLSLGFFFCAVFASAGPVDFGLAEYNAALASRGLKTKITAELSLDPPETFRIEPYRLGGAHVTGGDLRGLMYGLIEAAEQIRETGRFAQVHRVPYAPVRGVRIFARDWNFARYPDEFWRGYFQMLARDHFNRFTLVLLEPVPYPFLVAVESYPQVRAAGLPDDQRDRNLHALRFISQTAADYAIDFTLGIWDNPPSTPKTEFEGLAPSNLGPYTHAALRKLLAACPTVRRIQIQSSVLDAAFYRENIFPALRAVGRRVTLDPRGALKEPDFIRAAQRAGVALDLSLGSWPAGFEIDPPMDPGKWEFERHKLFYWSWGRLGYDPQTKPPKGENPAEYSAANRVIRLLMDAHVSDPNMYTWPLANPGIRLPSKDAVPDEWSPVFTIREAVRARLDRLASARRTPLETADLLTAAASSLEKSSSPDFQLLAGLARYHAHKQRAAYHFELYDQARRFDPAETAASFDLAELELKHALAEWRSIEKISGDSAADHPDLLDLSVGHAARRTGNSATPASPIPALAKPLPRPQFMHEPAKTVVADQPMTVTLRLAVPKDVKAGKDIKPEKDIKVIRLHYRNTSPSATVKVIEKAAEPSVSFTIPGADLPANADLVYYFEIIGATNTGWIDPDPLSGLPYRVAAEPPVY